MGGEGIPTNGKYIEDRRFILAQLEGLTASIDKLVDTVHALDKRLVVIETKALVLGAGAGILVSLVIGLLQVFMP